MDESLGSGRAVPHLHEEDVCDVELPCLVLGAELGRLTEELLHLANTQDRETERERETTRQHTAGTRAFSRKSTVDASMKTHVCQSITSESPNQSLEDSIMKDSASFTMG